MDRKEVLLKAAFDLLVTINDSPYPISDAMMITVDYDGTRCDAYCLMSDIAAELDIDEDE